MSFYHVLPSNAAPETYPQNRASSYLTPLGIPYNLLGKWEVAMTSVSYSGCVNTFVEEDIITVTKKLNTVEDLKTITRPVRIDLHNSSAKTRLQIAGLLNDTLKGILEVKHDIQSQPYVKGEDYFIWLGQSSEFVVILSEALSGLFKLWQRTISSYDETTTNYEPFQKRQPSEELSAEKLKDLHVILVRVSHNSRKIIIKEANEHLTAEEVIERVNTRIPNVNLKIAKSKKHFLLEKVCPPRGDCQKELIVMSKEFHKSMGFRRAGMYKEGLVRFEEYKFDNQFKNEWSVTLTQLNDILNATDPYEWVHRLKSKSFQEHMHAISYLNTLDSDLKFSLNNEKKLTLEIKRNKMKVSFSPILRDCLAFDGDTCENKGKHLASGMFSLSRRISYLYIYSNVGEYCKVGDTHAPLLGIVPLEGEGCDIVQERIFQNPMYVPLRANFMTHIEVLLCDGSGVPVPFIADAQSVVCLHFKQV